MQQLRPAQPNKYLKKFFGRVFLYLVKLDIHILNDTDIPLKVLNLEGLALLYQESQTRILIIAAFIILRKIRISMQPK